MLQQLAQQLRSPDPEQRKQAINALVELDDPRVLSAMKRLAANDPDPSVREEAEQAERTIQVRQWKQSESDNAAIVAEQQTGIAPSTSADAFAEALNDPAASAEARSELATALERRRSGNKSGALDALARAIEFHPPYRRVPAIRQLARDLTGKVPDEAMALLLSRLESKGADKKKRSDAGGSSSGDASWAVLILELVLLFLVAAGSILILFTLFRQSPELATQLASAPASTRAQFDSIMQASQVTLIPIAAIAGVAIVIGLLLYNLGLHYFSVFVLSGEGDFVSFLNAQLGVDIVSYLLTTVIYALPFLVTRLPANSQKAILSIDQIFVPIASLGVLIASVYYVSKVERFGIMRGIIAVIVAPIAFGILCVCGLFALSFLTAFSRTR